MSAAQRELFVEMRMLLRLFVVFMIPSCVATDMRDELN